MSGQCSKRIYSSDFGRSRQCARNGVIERDGRVYCKQHDPIAKAERNRKRMEVQIAASEAKSRQVRMNLAAQDMYEALKAAVESGLVPKSSVSDGGACGHSEQVRVADMIRAAIAKAEAR